MTRQDVWCFILYFVLMVLLIFSGQTLYAEQILYVNNTQVNVRSSPTTAKKNVIDTISKGTPVNVLSRQGSWYQVSLPDGRTGWISEWVLERRESAPRESAPPPSTSRTLSQKPEILPVLPGDLQKPEILPAQPGERFTDDMAFIPGGTGIIGSDEADIEPIIQSENISRDMLTDELPRETISIRGFYIDRYEVTNAQYKQFVDATRYPPPLNWDNGMYPSGTEHHPVTFISWDDAHAFAEWAGKRLPTAEEWEIAARGMNGQVYPWGNTFDLQLIHVDTPESGPVPVGTRSDDVSPYEVYDMGGNVTEWTLTQYEGNRDFFVLKGGSWAGKRFEARGANKTPGEAIYQLSHIGFRCAKSAGGQ